MNQPKPAMDEATARLGMKAAAETRDAALTARRDLLAAGWTPDHNLCEQLDRTAAHFAAWWEAYRRHLYAAITENDAGGDTDA